MISKRPCFTVGLTGGIASGKSAVSRFFEKKAVDVIDADLIAREVVLSNSEGLKQLVDTFGALILNEDKTLDRQKLRKLVFNDSKKLATINSILHPLIQQRIVQDRLKVKNTYCIIVIPLLCESSQYSWLDRILVVDVKPEIQMQRLLKRDGITHKLAEKMINSQCSREMRLQIADDVINNENSLTELNKHSEKLHILYKNF